MVQPHERIYASGITKLTRTASWGGEASSMAGVLMQYVASAPLVLGGGQGSLRHLAAEFPGA
jgi:hypothetical protein